MSVESEFGQVADKRRVWPAILKGLKGKCPRCGDGNLFAKWLKVTPQCTGCKQELHHERAQDFPPYIVITIVGHIVVTALMIVEANVDLLLSTHLFIWIPLTIVLSLALLQPVKGGVVGMQWALRMFGFGDGYDEDRGGDYGNHHGARD